MIRYLGIRLGVRFEVVSGLIFEYVLGTTNTILVAVRNRLLSC
jgi:hypothetical protein